MPRQLPWKVSTPKVPPERRRTADNAAPSTTRSPAPADHSATWPTVKLKSETPNPSTSKSRPSLTARPERSPSTSPPPEPPVEESMIEGIDRDDRYRMVEDELFSIASTFTKHLHAAEYQRLKALANTRNADMIRSISRPVTGRMTDVVKKRQAAVKLAASQRQGLRNALGKRKGATGLSDSDDDRQPPWTGTSLQALMDSPRKKKVPLSALAGVTVGARAPAGPHYPSRAGDSRLPRTNKARLESLRAPNSIPWERRDELPGSGSDSDGLDRQPMLPSRYRSQYHSTGQPVPVRQSPTGTGVLATRQPPAPETSRPDLDMAMISETIAGPAEDSPAHDDGGSDDFLSRIRNRRSQQRRRREPTSGAEDKGKKDSGRNSLDAIPLF